MLDTLDPAYAARVFDAGGLPLVVSRPPPTGVSGPRRTGKFQHYDPASRLEHDSASCRGAIVPYRRAGAGMLEIAPPEGLDELLELADGLLLTGGGDVDPASYGARPENVADDDPEADAFELALIAAARERELPTLAICRGAQLLAVAHGGRLAQRLSGGDGHAELADLTPEAILSARHPIELAPGSRVEHALGSGPIAVNTIHHHEIADAGELAVTATAAGRTIEAVEPRSTWPCVGVQWHPEKMPESGQARLFAQLVTAARGPWEARSASGVRA